MDNETWSATPRNARWYGEVIYGRTLCPCEGPCDPSDRSYHERAYGTETESVDGYSADALPDPSEMCPDGYEVLEETLVPINREA